MNGLVSSFMIGGVLAVRFAVEVVAVLVGLVIWDRWFRRR